MATAKVPLRLFLALAVTGFWLAFSMVMAGHVRADGWSRGPKNNTEKTRADLCNDKNQSANVFGATWINGVSGSDTSDNRWRDDMSVGTDDGVINATMWTTAYNCPGSGVTISNVQITNLTAKNGSGQVPITFTSGTTINRGTGSTGPGQWTDPPGSLTIQLDITGKATGCYTVSYTGTYNDSRPGSGYSTNYITQLCIARPSKATSGTIQGYKMANGSNSSPVADAPVHYDCCSNPPGNVSLYDNPYFYRDLPIGEHQVSVPYNYNSYVFDHYEYRYEGGGPSGSGTGTAVYSNLNFGSVMDLWFYYERPATATNVQANCSLIKGTVSDPDYPSNDLNIVVTITRWDGSNYYSRRDGFNTGGSNFTYNIPDEIKNPYTYNVTVQVQSRNTNGEQKDWTTIYSNSNFGPCDTKPSLNISADCTAQKAIITTNDSDYDPDNYQVFYSIAGRGEQVANGPRIELDMSREGQGGYDPVTISARTSGVINSGKPGPNASQVSTTGYYGRSASQGCKARNFSITPTVSINFDNDEDPSSATISSNLTFTYEPTSGGSLNLTNGNIDVYLLRSGNPTPVNAGLSDISINGSYNGEATILAYNTPNTQSVGGLGLSPGDRVCARVVLGYSQGTVYSDGTVASSNTPLTTDQSCATLVNRPYLKAYSGDVMAGGGFGSACLTSASIKAQAGRSGTIASSDQGVFANGSIIAFASAALNTSGKPGQDQFSLRQHTPGTCLTDFFAAKAGAPFTAFPAAANANFQQYKIDGDYTLGGPSTINRGVRAVLFVDGTLTINNNITYDQPNNRSGEADIQALYIVARNIVIANNVTTLDGIYIAEPNNGSGGTIDTCKNYNAGNAYGACNNQLFVNGALIAQKINFHRTYKSLRFGSLNEPYGASSGAEVIRFTPEVFLLNSPFKDAGIKYDAYADLPPNF